MTLENGVRIMAGVMILISIALTKFVNAMWVWLTVFVAVNLIQSAFTGICPAVFFLKKLGFKDECCQPAEKADESQS